MFDELVHKTVLLDNNQYYQIIWSKEIEGHRILYLLNIFDFSDPLFCEKLSDGYLEEIEDEAFLEKVILSISRDINIFIL